MTAKEYLSQAYRLDEQITSKINVLDSLNELARKSTAVMTGMPGSPNRDKQTMESTICKIIDLQAEINKDIDTLVDLKAEILSVINAVENIDYRLLLHKRYIENMSWPEIAVDLNVGMRRMYYLHDQALLCVEIPY